MGVALNCLLYNFILTLNFHFFNCQYSMVVIVVVSKISMVKVSGFPSVEQTLLQLAPGFLVPLAVSVNREQSGTRNPSERSFGAALRFFDSVFLYALS